MRCAWTTETFGFALRDSRGYARAIISRSAERNARFYGQIITSGMPASGPYKNRQDAADWVARMCVRLEHLPADSTFGELPIVPMGKRAA